MNNRIKSMLDTLKKNEIAPEEFREVKFLEKNKTIASEIALRSDHPEGCSIIVRFILFQMQFKIMFGFIKENEDSEKRSVIAANIVFGEMNKNRLIETGSYFMVQGDEIDGDKLNEVFDASTINFIEDVLVTVENVVKKKVQEKTAKGE